MKRAALFFGIGLLAPMIQGALSPFLPQAASPDVALLLVIGMGVALRSAAGGVAFAAWIGFVSDLLSGSLLGQHALLCLVAFGLARLTSLHVNLQGPFTQMALAAATSVVKAVGLAALTAFFAAGALPLTSAGEVAWQAGANALLAPFVVAFVAWLLAKVGDDDGRRLLRLETRSFST